MLDVKIRIQIAESRADLFEVFTCCQSGAVERGSVLVRESLDRGIGQVIGRS